ncbi:ATP-binding cassette domain-containing protein [Enterococcus hirae]|uniref:ATP-binding cassette domain-containing protein n=1 Tax=Enterococcus hirae TaxID=1354 RepID=UPI0039A636E9
MTILKYGSKLRLAVFLISTSLSSLQYIFQAFIIGNFITAATNADLIFFVKNVTFAVVGIPLFGIVMLINVSARTNYIKSVNIEIKERAIEHLIQKNIHEIDVSSDLSFIMNDLKLLETNGINAVLSILTSAITFLFALFSSLKYDIWTTAAFFLGSLIPLIISNVTMKQIRGKSEKWSEETSRFLSRLKDFLTATRTIRTYQVEKEMAARVSHYARKSENALKDMNQTVGYSNAVVTVLATLCALTLPFGIGILRIINSSLTLGAFISVVQLSNYLNKPLLSVLEMRNQLQTTREIQKRVDRVLKDSKTNRLLERSDSKRASISISPFSKLELRDVTIQLGNKRVISRLNLTINAGEKMLIMASSGFGKSTLLGVLQGNVPILEGEYLYNGISTSNYTVSQLSEQFSLILQTPFVFNDAVRFNVTLDRSFSEESIFTALDHAGMKQFISEKGLDYIIAENGQNLSGGELQRIEIARAFLYNRPIILADEATSSLDNITAAHIRNTFINSPNTLIEVAHKVSQEEQLLYDKVLKLEGNE